MLGITMRTAIALLLAVVPLSSCARRFENVHVFPAPGGPCKALVVIEQTADWGYPYPFGFVDERNELRFIRAEIDAMGQIQRFLFSPSGEMVIIESVGEGHPYLSVYRVRDLVNKYYCDRIAAVGVLDPYPYGFWDVRWISEDCIEFGAHSDFNDFDRKSRRGGYSLGGDDEVRRLWRWHLKTDIFREAGV